MTSSVITLFSIPSPICQGIPHPALSCCCLLHTPGLSHHLPLGSCGLLLGHSASSLAQVSRSFITKHLSLRETSVTARFKFLPTLVFQKHLVSLLVVVTPLLPGTFLTSLYLLSASLLHTRKCVLHKSGAFVCSRRSSVPGP